MRIAGIPVYWNGINGVGAEVWFTAGFMIDGDGANGQGGSGHACYHPNGAPPGLDYTGNAGEPGNWWALVTDNQMPTGNPLIQTSAQPAPGFYISTTAYTLKPYKYADPRRYVDSESVPFAVIPPKLRNAISPKFLGCAVEMINMDNGRMTLGGMFDIGPNGKLGEGSIKAAKDLGLKSSPKNGGTNSRIIYFKLFPGEPAVIDGKTYPLI